MLRYALIVIGFALIATLYFTPATFEGRTLFRQDIEGTAGMGSDVRELRRETGERSYWTNSMFGGMPMYQIAPEYPSTAALSCVQGAYTLSYPLKLTGEYPWLLFGLLIGFFILMKVMGVKDGIAILGSIAWCFSSYFVILITAGHLWKLMTLMYIPPTIAGMLLIYRGKRWQGAFLLALFTALQVLSNHVQMTYYFLFVMVALFIAFFVEAIRQKTVKSFLVSSCFVLGAGIIGVAVNSSNLYHTYQYGKQTMRGGSELTATDPQKAEVNGSGLSKEYITQWSYGVGETLSLLVPDIRGGASEAIGSKPERLDKVRPDLRNTVAQSPSYWGEQPFTSGPVYVGAFILCLAILGCFVVKSPIKYALLVVTLLSVLLSWGKNFMPLTDLFINYFPLYDKFRSVSSFLVVAEFTIPLMAALALAELIRCPGLLREQKTATIVSFGLPMLICLVLALFPSIAGSFITQAEEAQLRPLMMQDPAYSALRDALASVRKGLLVSDAWRSVLIIAIGFALIYLYDRRTQKALKEPVLIGALCLLTLIDLWSVAKRYLHDDMFRMQEQTEAQMRPLTAADEEIIKEAKPADRVLNLSVNTFNDATTSLWHLSVGGYHAAKLQRYQDLIDHQLIRLNPEVLNMLNTRFIIIPNEDGTAQRVERNPYAYGPAWFVERIKAVATPDEEMAALSSEPLRTTAVMEQRFAQAAGKGETSAPDPADSIYLTHFQPNEAVYQSRCASPRLALFSEIYYPEGWKAYIDGDPKQEVPILRANWTLRAALLPAGAHTVTFRFDPPSLHRTEAVAFTAFALLVLLLIAAIVLPCIEQKRKTDHTVKE